MRKNKIAIIIPWFGPWPEWIDYFLISCQGNPDIDWIIPSDSSPPKLSSPNLKFIPYSLKAFNEKAREVLNLEINIQHPYKICDFKPAYAEIFSEHNRDYEFWGYGDLDLVYGDIGHWLNDELLQSSDIISGNSDFTPGHFCILRNSKEINALYKKSDAYKTSFLDPLYVGFDEQIKNMKINPDPRYVDMERKWDRMGHTLNYRIRNGIKKIMPGISKLSKGTEKNSDLKDFSGIVKHAGQTQGIRISPALTYESDLMAEKRGVKDWEVQWTNGKLLNKAGRELTYFHFILSKQRKAFNTEPLIRDMKAFSISPKGITQKSE